MPETTANCPEHRQLVALLESSLSEQDSREIEQHLATCASCEEKLAGLVSQHNGDWAEYRQMLDTNVADAADTVPPIEFDAQTLIHKLELLGFEDLHELGRGGMGIVLSARQPSMHRTVAIKMLPSGALAGPQRTQRLLSEARAIGQLNHENVLKIFDTVDSDDLTCLVLEHAGGGSLASLLSDGPLTSDRAVELAMQIAGGLAHAHANNILHRDIKPANILLTSVAQGNQPVAKLADFGLAKDVDRSAELTGSMIIGTPTYMSPEQISGQNDLVSEATDIYAMGVVLYEMLVGAPPFRGPTPSAVHHLVTSQPPVPPRQIQPSIPKDLETICLKCLEKVPADRYASAQALYEDLARFSEGHPIAARRASPLKRTVKWCQRNPAAATLVATAGVAILAVGTVWGVLTAQLSRVNTELAGKNVTLNERNAQLDAANAELGETVDQLQIQQQETNRQLTATKALRGFLIKDLLSNASPGQRMSAATDAGDNATESVKEPTIRELVLKAANSFVGDGLEERFPDQPQVQAEVLTAVSVILGDMGEFDMAAAVAERAIEIHPAADQEFDKDHYGNLLSYTVQCISTGEFERAIDVGTLIMVQAEEHGEMRMHFGAMHNVAGSYMMLDQPEIAVDFSERALAGLTELLGLNDPLTLQATATHGQILEELGQYNDAALVLTSSVAGFTNLLTEKHPRTISAIGKLAAVLTSAKEYDRAIGLYQKQIELSQEVNGPDHPRSLFAEANLGNALAKSGQIAAGVDVMLSAREKLVAKLGADHQFVVAMSKEIERQSAKLD